MHYFAVIPNVLTKSHTLHVRFQRRQTGSDALIKAVVTLQQLHAINLYKGSDYRGQWALEAAIGAN